MKIEKSVKGFTLIEIMIVVTIIGVLAGIAYPSYMEYVRKSNRADAKVALTDTAQRLQRCFTAYSSYNNAGCGVFNSLANGGAINSSESLYEVTGVVNATTFELTATPLAGTTQANDSKCTTLTLANTGARSATGNAPDQCW